MNSHSRKYAVITPVRDEEAFVPATIESMIHQTILPDEWIIVDDGSTDNIAGTIERYLPDPRIRYVSQQNRGLPGARNAVGAASGFGLQ